MGDDKEVPCNIEIRAVDFPMEARMEGLAAPAEQKPASVEEDTLASQGKSTTGYSQPLPANFEFTETTSREPVFLASNQKFGNTMSNEILVPIAVLPSKRYEETKSIQSIIESSKAQ